MKNRFNRSLTLLSFAVLLLAGISFAQYAEHTVRVTIPFEFTAGNQSFAAGQYLIVRTDADKLEIRDTRGHVLKTLIAHSVQTLNPGVARVAFSTANGGHELLRVWTEPGSVGSELPASKPGMLLAKHNVQNTTQAVNGGNK
jgi:hypothetical protein